MGSEKSTKSGFDDSNPQYPPPPPPPPPPSLFPMFEGQSKQNVTVGKYLINFIQNHKKIDKVITGSL